jgi:SagB-type dehydrogenase family enzyme
MTSKITLFVLAIVCLAMIGWAGEQEDLLAEAQQKMAAQEYDEALELYGKAFKVGDAHYSDYYNAACLAALTEDAETAFEYLTNAVEAGLVEREWLENDPDLESLRSSNRWERVLTALDSKVEALVASFPEIHSEEAVLDLPEPKTDGETSVEQALGNRRSIRTYTDTPLTLAEISQLLWAAYGITMPIEDGPDFLRGGLRTAPSAGARYPLDLYIVARNVEGLRAGVYWYKSETHQLVTIASEDRWEALSEAGFYQSHFETATAALVYSAVFERNTSKYGERGRERYVCMDLGHSAENVYLQAYALKIGTCAVGAFGDIALKQAVGMTKPEEPLYIMPLGKVE